MIFPASKVFFFFFFLLQPPLMDAEAVINLFDSCWFCHEILKIQPRKSSSESPEANPDHQNQEHDSELPDISIQPTITHVRSKSHDQLSSMRSFNSEDYLSPDSVLSTPHLLQTILSGKEASEEELTIHPRVIEWKLQKQPPKRSRSMMRRRKERGMTKSLSDLEFEELKGFMDLGFVFSEEDRNDSTLVEIIPGLQRLGKDEDDGDVDERQEENSFDESSSVVARPYLSEAWGVWDRRSREENPLMNWRIPTLGNEIDIKDSLKMWAHTVASTVIS